MDRKQNIVLLSFVLALVGAPAALLLYVRYDYNRGVRAARTAPDLAQSGRFLSQSPSRETSYTPVRGKLCCNPSSPDRAAGRHILAQRRRDNLEGVRESEDVWLICLFPTARTAGTGEEWFTRENNPVH